MNKNIMKLIIIMMSLGFILGIIYIIPNFDLSFNNDYLIASTKNPQKAEQLQEILTTTHRPTGRILITDNNDKSKYFGITINKKLISKKEYENIVINLINNPIVDKSVYISPDIKYTKNLEKETGRVESYYKNIIQRIDGVKYAYIHYSYNVPTSEIQSQNAKLESIYIDFKTSDNADNKQISEAIKRLINPPSPYIKIYITNDTLLEQARKLVLNKEYLKALKIVTELSKYDSSQSEATDELRQIIDINNKIKQNPNNFKLYEMRGDIQNIPETKILIGEKSGIIVDYGNTIANYTTALKLNPRAYWIYEKLADAYSAIQMQSFKTCKAKEITQNKNFAIENYKKAIKYTKRNDRLYLKLGNVYYNKKDYASALNNYLKIKDLYAERSQKNLPQVDGEPAEVPFNIVNCYQKLGDYQKAIDICHETLEHTTDKNDIKYLKKKLFQLHVKCFYTLNR